MSQTAGSSDLVINSDPSELQPLDIIRLNKSKTEDRRKARRLSITNRELLLAISENNVDRIDNLLNAGADINFKDSDGNTPFHWALETENLDILKFLLKQPNIRHDTIESLVTYVKSLNRPDILQIVETLLNVKPESNDDEVLQQFIVGNTELNKIGVEKNYKEDDNCKILYHTNFEKMDITFKTFNQLYTSQQNDQKNQKKHVPAIHGHIYQLKLLMLFLYRGVSQKYSFCLGTEIPEAKKFDDLVFEYIQDGKKVYRLLQAKHKQDESKKITAYNLLSEQNGNYNLMKYFISYHTSKNEKLFKDGLIKDVTICTNIDWDFEDLEREHITVKKIINADDVLDLKSTEKHSLRYKFGKELIPLLKSRLDNSSTNSAKESVKYTINDIQDFLDHLVFAVNQPNEEELGKILENEMGKEFGLITTENVYNKFFIKMLNWLKDKNIDRFLSYKEGREFFEEAKTGIPVWFNIKNPTHLFTGRVKELTDIHKMLKDQRKDSGRLLSICGLGGVGKSELVRAYINKYSREYENKIIWINAESYRTLVQSFQRLARDKLRISTINADNEEKDINSIVEDVYKFLHERKSLFIFDNAEKYRSESEFDNGIENFLPSMPSVCNRPYVLITSRNKRWPKNVHILQLDVFKEDEATEYVKRSLGPNDGLKDSDIRELIRQLHCLPLALQQAVAYVKVQDEKVQNVGKAYTVLDYLEEYKVKAGDVLDFKFSESTSNDYAKTVLTCWNITLDIIKQKEHGDNALKILYVTSYLAPEDIPTEIFLGIIKDQEKLASAVELLKQYSMVNFEHAAINVHRLVQLVIRMKLENSNMEEEVLTMAFALFHSQEVISNNVNHAITLCNNSSKYNQFVFGAMCLTNCIASALMNSFRYGEAYSSLQKVLELFYKVQATDSSIAPIENSIKNNIGLVCLKLGKYDEACRIYQEALCRVQSISGPCSPETIVVKTNLAHALFTQGEYTEALKHQKELYDVKVSLNLDQFEITYTKADIAAIFLRQGKFDEALSILKEVYDFRERALGPHDPLTLETNGRIACVLVEQSKYDEAVNMYRRIYNIEKFILKRNAFESTTVMSNMAGILYKQGKSNAALKIYQEALNIQKDHLGEDHPNVLNTRMQILQIVQELGNPDEALVDCEDIINRQKRVLRPDHPDISHSMRIKALILHSLLKYDDALEVYQQVLSKWKSIYGDEHPQILSLKCAIADVYSSQGKYDQALANCQDIVKIQERKLGANHINTLNTKNSIGLLLYYKGEFENAFRILQDIFNTHRKLYPDQLSIHAIKSNIGLVLLARGQYDEALNVYREILDFRRRSLHNEHPDVITTKNNIAAILIYQKKYGESLVLLHDVFKNFSKRLNRDDPQMVQMRGTIQSVLRYAIDKNDVEQIRYFFENDANITLVDFDSAILLCHAIDNGNMDILNVFLNNGANPGAVNDQGKTALHVAVLKNSIEIVEALLRHVRSDELSNFINAKTSATGSAPLHIAAKHGYSEIVKLLLARGAIYNLINNNGKTPLSLSRDHGIINLLKLIDELFQLAKNGKGELINKLGTLQYDVFKVVNNVCDNEKNNLLEIIKINNRKDLLRNYMELLTTM